MIKHGWLRQVRNTSALVLLAFILVGCLSDEKAKSTEETVTDNVLTGSVGDGPVVGATLRILRNDGEELMRLESDANAEYNVTINTKGKSYPLTIEATGGIDIVTNLAPDFTLLGVVVEPDNRTIANINPYSTFAVAIARDLPGGVTADNISMAQDIAVTMLNSGLSTLAASGPLSTGINSSNISEIVKASETLAESVRRTRNLLQTYGYATSGNDVVLRLASDLNDRVMDGRGGLRADARTAAVAKVVMTLVLLESMSNELRVNGAIANNAMTSAINQVTGSVPQKTIDDLTVTAPMLLAARTGLTAALAVSDTPKLTQLDQAVDGLQAGMDYMLVQTLLPDDYRATLDSVLALIAGGDASVISTINNINEPDEPDAPPNRAPSIQGVPLTSVQAGSPYSFDASASDPDGDALTFSIAGIPVWANFNESTGELTGMPTANQVGTYPNIIISVTDGEFSSNLPAFTITVSAVVTNTPPVISGTPPSSVVANSAYTFTPTASDADNDTLTFSVTGLPGWANFNTGTGRISGTPGDANVGVYSNIRITVSDGAASASLSPFSITVSAVVTNTPPVISGTPPSSVVANSAYTFTPTASDADNDTLTFSVTALPAWANFNTNSGRISGTPGDADVGLYSNIRITVSDGAASASLNPFSITVNAISTGSVTLTWTAPTLNEDGTPLTDLAGYKIYWGTSSGTYPNSVTLNNPGLTMYVVENLAAGTYEFVATSLNSTGVESRYSSPAVKTVQ